jgi:glycosyltransferase involved in cell wall biosynthesis
MAQITFSHSPAGMVMSNGNTPRGGTVLHFTPSLVGGGAETMLRNLVEAMHGGAWRTVLVVMSTRGAEAEVEQLRDKVYALYDMSVRSYLRPSTWKKLRAIIRREKPDVVQTWMHRADLVGGIISRFCGVKNVVWSIHSRDIYRSPGESDAKIERYRKALVRASKRVPKRIVSCSTTAIRDHEGWGFPKDKFTWIPNGISTARFVPNEEAGQAYRVEQGIPEDAPVIGFTGRFHSVKDLPTFFRAAGHLQRQMPNAHFVMCGGSAENLEPAALEAYQAMPHPEQVRFTSFIKDPERLYPAFSLLSLCSRSEALPMVLLEAMACGVPCVATDVGDCKDVIGDTGLVVPKGDAPALTAAWATMLTRLNVNRTYMAAKVRQRVEEQFSIDRVARRYEETYESLLPAAKPRASASNEPTPVMHVITSLWLGGAETMLCQLLEHTDRKKFTPIVVSLRPAAELAARVQAAGVRLICLNMEPTPKDMLRGLRELKRIMKKFRPALVQTWMYHADLMGSLAARSLSPRPPVVWNIQHGEMNPKETKRASLWLTRALAPLSRWLPDRIFICSRSSIETHVKLGYARRKLIHIPNGADCERFKPDSKMRREVRQELGIPLDAPVIGMAGRYNPQKDYANFFGAIRIFQLSDARAHFVACGTNVTPENPELAELLAKCPDPSRVHLIGPRRDMPRIYQAFDIATLSSAHGEGMPVTLCEALACGVPAVATDVGDSADVIGPTGRIVPPRNASALAGAWRQVLGLPAYERMELARLARHRVQKNFSLPVIASLYETLHESLIGFPTIATPPAPAAAEPIVADCIA